MVGLYFQAAQLGWGRDPVESLSSPHPSALALWPHGNGCRSLCVRVTLLNPAIFGSTLEVIQDSK